MGTTFKNTDENFSKFIRQALEGGIKADQISEAFSQNGYSLSVPTIHRWARAEVVPGPVARTQIVSRIAVLKPI